MHISAKLLARLAAAKSLHSDDPRVLANTGTLLLLGLISLHSLATIRDKDTGLDKYPTIGSIMSSDDEEIDANVWAWIKELMIDEPWDFDGATQQHIASKLTEPNWNTGLMSFVDEIWKKFIALGPAITQAYDATGSKEVEELLQCLSEVISQQMYKRP